MTTSERQRHGCTSVSALMRWRFSRTVGCHSRGAGIHSWGRAQSHGSWIPAWRRNDRVDSQSSRQPTHKDESRPRRVRPPSGSPTSVVRSERRRPPQQYETGLPLIGKARMALLFSSFARSDYPCVGGSGLGSCESPLAAFAWARFRSASLMRRVSPPASPAATGRGACFGDFFGAAAGAP